MGGDERVGWLLLGMAVGFIMGYIVRTLRELRSDVHEVKEELHEVDGIVKKKLGERGNDSGFVIPETLRNILLLVVVLVVAGSAFVSQKASNEVHNSADCNYEFLIKTISALNERTEFTTQQAQANIELQKSQQAFFELLLRKPPETEARRSAAAQEYLASLNNYIDLSKLSTNKIEENPYPEAKQLQDCLN